MMKFKSEVTTSDIDELESLLDKLPDKIDEIQSYDFGRDVVRSDRSYDFALVSIFSNLDTLKHYQEHPEHQIVVKKLSGMCSHIVAVDYKNKPYIQKDDDPYHQLGSMGK